jgi:RNA polymerase sigma factor (sigma-70 family)
MLRRDSATEQVELPDIAAVTNEDDDRAFVDLIAPLQPETRILFILRYVYEYKVAEIAELLDMKPGSIKSTLSRATAQLRSIHSDTNPDVQSPQCANLGRQE